MSTTVSKQEKRTRRHGRVRSKIFGTATCPRLAVFRSNRFMYAQLIDDEKAVTLTALDSKKMEGVTARERATALGKALATQAVKLGIEKVVFDRGGFLYAGSIKSFADSAREGGLKF